MTFIKGISSQDFKYLQLNYLLPRRNLFLPTLDKLINDNEINAEIKPNILR